jgi:hypothetical protein
LLKCIKLAGRANLAALDPLARQNTLLLDCGDRSAEPAVLDHAHFSDLRRAKTDVQREFAWFS